MNTEPAVECPKSFVSSASRDGPTGHDSSPFRASPPAGRDHQADRGERRGSAIGYSSARHVARGDAEDRQPDFTGLVLAGLLVASGLMIQSWPRLGIIGFTIAAAIALYLILTIIVTDRKKRDG